MVLALSQKTQAVAGQGEGDFFWANPAWENKPAIQIGQRTFLKTRVVLIWGVWRSDLLAKKALDNVPYWG